MGRLVAIGDSKLVVLSSSSSTTTNYYYYYQVWAWTADLVSPPLSVLPEAPSRPVVTTLPVGPTESLVLVPVHLIAVVVCAPVLVLEIAVAAVAAAAPAAMAAAVADGIVGAASP